MTAEVKMEVVFFENKKIFSSKHGDKCFFGCIDCNDGFEHKKD